MRRVTALIGAAGVVLAVFSAALLLRPSTHQHAMVPPGATDVRVEVWRQSSARTCQRTSYHMPPGWSLFDQYAYLEAHALTRDIDVDRALRRNLTEWQTSTFAIFVRSSWLGLVSERATVALAPNGHPRPQVSVDRCFMTELWTDWL